MSWYLDPYYGSLFYHPYSPVIYRYTSLCPEGSPVAPAKEVGRAYVKLTDEKLLVKLDVHQYAPEEVSVITDAGRFLVIQADHREKVDRDIILSRSFRRRFIIPEDADVQKLETEINPEGQLAVYLPRKHGSEGEGMVHKITHALGSFFHVPGHHYHGSVVPRPNECHGSGIEPTGVQLTKGNLTIKLEVSQFAADEVLVKVVGDKLVISGEHKENEDDGKEFISKSFIRQYFLPLNADTDKLICEMDGKLLIVTVPRIRPEGGEKEKVFVPIKV